MTVTRWEYLTKFMRANARDKQVKTFLQDTYPEWKRPPRFTPEALIPELNLLGELGWELVHMEPVADVGSKGDVRFEGDGVTWSNVYFCVFKRAKPTPISYQATVTGVQPAVPAQPPPPTAEPPPTPPSTPTVAQQKATEENPTLVVPPDEPPPPETAPE